MHHTLLTALQFPCKTVIFLLKQKLKEKIILLPIQYQLRPPSDVINIYRSVSKVKSACLALSRALKLSEEPSQALSSPYQRLQRQPLLNDGLLDLLLVKVQSVVILITAIMYKQRPGVIQQCQRRLKKKSHFNLLLALKRHIWNGFVLKSSEWKGEKRITKWHLFLENYTTGEGILPPLITIKWFIKWFNMTLGSWQMIKSWQEDKLQTKWEIKFIRVPPLGNENL